MELDIIQAVLANEIGNLTIQKEKILLLSTLKYEKDFKQTQEALIRVINLAKKYDTAQEKVDPSRFKTESERKLYQETKRAIIAVHQAIKANDLKAVLSQLTHLAQPVTVFFEEN